MITEKAADDFRSRLVGLIKQDGRSASEIARAIDESPQLMRKWVCCNVLSRLPAANYVLKLADCFGVNMRWLISGEGPIKNAALDEVNSIEVPTIEAHLANVGNEPIKQEDLIRVPNERIRNKNFETIIKLPFFMRITGTPVVYSKAYLEKLQADPESCARLLAPDDAMDPLIKDGDYVLVDCSDNEVERIKNNAVYVFEFEQNLYMRRLVRDLDSIALVAADEKYPRKEYSMDQAKNVLHIVGRVLERTGSL